MRYAIAVRNETTAPINPANTISRSGIFERLIMPSMAISYSVYQLFLVMPDLRAG